MIRLGCLLVVVILIAIPTVASHYLPWWGVPLVILVEGLLLLFTVPKLIGWGVKRFAIGLFMTKSRVLRGATVHIHEVRATTKPVRRVENAPALEGGGGDVIADAITAADGTTVLSPRASGDDAAPEEKSDGKRYVLIDFTLTPKPGSSKMQHYEPSELVLVPIGYVIELKEDPTSGGAEASVDEIKRVEESGAQEDGYDKYTGPGRYRAVFAVPPTLSGRVKFRYYFESFGDVTLP